MHIPDPRALFTVDEHIRAAQELHDALTGGRRVARADQWDDENQAHVPEPRSLPEPTTADVAFWDVVGSRTSTYRCAREAPDLARIAALLHAYQRTPSAGGLRSTKLMLVNTRDEHGEALAAPEAFRWDPAQPNTLTGHRTLTPEALDSALVQRELAGTFPWIVFMVADVRALVTGGDFTSYRMVYADAGVIGATLHLAAEATGLAGRIVGGIDSQRAHEMLGLSAEEIVSVAFVVGSKAPPAR